MVMRYIFWDKEVFERLSKAETDGLRVLYEIVFGAKKVSSWFRGRILRFDFSRSLRFLSWLLNVETNGTVEVLCQEICSLLCRRSVVGGKNETVRRIQECRRQ
jgi:hypothetical protein